MDNIYNYLLEKGFSKEAAAGIMGNIDVETGVIDSRFEGFDLPDLSCRPSVPTSDNIAGVGLKKKYATQIPVGKTISVAYNKGPYMIVDEKDFKTMGRKI